MRLKSMPHDHVRYPFREFLLRAFCLASLLFGSAFAADEELTLLSIAGDLIGKVESLDSDANPERIIDTYYALLLDAQRLHVESLHRQLIKLMPDYEVAFTAADSAEITEVKSDIDALWAEIRTVHAHYFAPEVVELLNAAYDSAFSPLRLAPTPTLDP